jgi:hypothetical protein
MMHELERNGDGALEVLRQRPTRRHRHSCQGPMKQH